MANELYLSIFYQFPIKGPFNWSTRPVRIRYQIIDWTVTRRTRSASASPSQRPARYPPCARQTTPPPGRPPCAFIPSSDNAQAVPESVDDSEPREIAPSVIHHLPHRDSPWRSPRHSAALITRLLLEYVAKIARNETGEADSLKARQEDHSRSSRAAELLSNVDLSQSITPPPHH
jgi:hypothetical protein